MNGLLEINFLNNRAAENAQAEKILREHASTDRGQNKTLAEAAAKAAARRPGVDQAKKGDDETVFITVSCRELGSPYGEQHKPRVGCSVGEALTETDKAFWARKGINHLGGAAPSDQAGFSDSLYQHQKQVVETIFGVPIRRPYGEAPNGPRPLDHYTNEQLLSYLAGVERPSEIEQQLAKRLRKLIDAAAVAAELAK